MRSILFPKPVDFKFNKDTYKFIGVLASIALMGFVYTIILMVGKYTVLVLLPINLPNSTIIMLHQVSLKTEEMIQVLRLI